MSFRDMSLEAIIQSLPLTEPVMLIMLSLAGQPRHGYAILKDVEQMSSGRVMLSTGTLYGALRRLRRLGRRGKPRLCKNHTGFPLSLIHI